MFLAIRRQQDAILGDARHRSFRDRAWAHVRKFFPAQAAALGEANGLALVDHAVERAASYGLRTERDVVKFLDLQCTFGPQFDSDAACPWRVALTDPAVPDPAARIDRTCDEALAWLGRGAPSSSRPPVPTPA